MEIVLNTFGTAISRDNEAFVVSSQDGRKRIPVEGVTAIRICKSSQITSDAVLLAVENEIEVVFADKSGNVIGRVWSPRYGSISTIRKGQLAFTQSSDAVEWIKKLLCRKIENQQALVLLMLTDNQPFIADIDKGIKKLEQYASKIMNLNGSVVSDVAQQIRGYEGYSAKLYFDMLNYYLPDEFKFENRSQHPATDVANALLNYGYGILYGKIEGSLIRAGIDPYLGILHRDEYNRPVLVYDVIEIYRIWIDYVVWSLLVQKAVTEEFYSFQSDGACWLETLGRKVVIQSVNDYLDEIITYKGVSRSRKTQIDLYAQELAQKFKKYQ
jgi:CRISPR-associated protein Cas1